MNIMTVIRVAVISLAAAGIVIPCVMFWRDVV